MAQQFNILESLGDLRVGKLLRSESDYDELYEKRQTRLRAMELDSEHLAELVADALKLTQKSRALSDELLKTIQLVEANYPNTTRSKLQLLDNRVRAAQPIDVGDAPNCSTSTTERLQRDADEFLVWLLSDQPRLEGYSPEVTVRQALRRKFAHERDGRIRILEVQVAMRHKLLQALDAQIEILVPMCSLLAIYRGLLFVGIFSVEGGKLDRKNRVDQLVGLGQELAGAFIPGLGIVLSLSRLLSAWLELDGTPDVLTNADLVQRYFDTYFGLLAEWVAVAGNLNDAVRSSAKLVLGSVVA